MAKNIVTIDIYMEPTTQARLANLCGPLDDNLKQIERRMGVEISHRDSLFQVLGRPEIAKPVSNMLRDLYIETQPVNGVMNDIMPETVHLALEQCHALQQNPDQNKYGKELYIKTRKGLIKPRNANQQEYVANILKHDITFGIGPAGTGKTYLAVACAIDALERQKVRRILLTRPAVEAGEKLGFLPGDLSQKVDPYLRPLYDALFEMLGFESVERLIEKNVIEVAPLAYMRGRTFNDAFIILDESQNTTAEQMKMFLTRIGFNSKAVITGDITQIDLPHHVTSGLRQSIEVLGGIADISFNFFQSGDIVRHQLVSQIVDAYQRFDTHQDSLKAEKKAQRLHLESSTSTQENS